VISVSLVRRGEWARARRRRLRQWAFVLVASARIIHPVDLPAISEPPYAALA